MTFLIDPAINLIGAGLSAYNNRQAYKKSMDILGQKQRGFNNVYGQAQENLNNDVLRNRQLAISNLQGRTNPWGTASFDSNGQLSQQLSPQAQQLFNNLLGQFNTGNIGGLKLNPDTNYLQRNINKATPRWVADKQNAERELISRGITPNSPAWDNAMRSINNNQAQERLGFEDNAFANDMAYQNQVLGNQNQLLNQLNNIKAPDPYGSLNVAGYNSSSLNNALFNNNDSYYDDMLNIVGNKNRGATDVMKLLTSAGNSFTNNMFRNKFLDLFKNQGTTSAEQLSKLPIIPHSYEA